MVEDTCAGVVASGTVNDGPGPSPCVGVPGLICVSGYPTPEPRPRRGPSHLNPRVIRARTPVVHQSKRRHLDMVGFERPSCLLRVS